MSLIPFERSFASHEKARFWNTELNGGLLPVDIYISCGKKFHFDCNVCNHTFEIRIANVSGSGNWCPYCSIKPSILCDKSTCELCFNRSFASVEKSKYLLSENNIIPRNVLKSLKTKCSFKCNICDHIFITGINNVSAGNWCVYCASHKLCSDERCQFCLDKSFASDSRSVYFNVELNDNLNPRYIFKYCNKYFWFNCDKCHHIFYIALSDVSSVNNCWCYYCSGKRLCDKDDCQSCFVRSFASHKYSVCWNLELNNNINPRNVSLCNNQKFWFNCNSCEHLIHITLGHISEGKWCSYCCNPPKKLCENAECKTCFSKSFASCFREKDWDYTKNIDILPRNVLKGSSKKMWFICEKNHSFNSVVATISKGVWCPLCVNKTEGILFEYLLINYPTTISQFSPEFIEKRRYDFCIPEHKIIIELDGAQHFRQVSNWQSHEETQRLDKFKEEEANKNGYSIIRILQEDVHKNKYDWKTELQQSIQYVINCKEIMNIYMCKNGEYDIPPPPLI